MGIEKANADEDKRALGVDVDYSALLASRGPDSAA